MMDPELSTPERLPDRLQDDLKALHDPRGRVPAELDEAILAAAPVTASVPGPHPVRRPFLVKAASLAAAALVIAVPAALVLWMRAQEEGRTPAPDVLVARAEDVDGSGRVDMLDALALAQRLEQGIGEAEESEELLARFDFDGDGRVTRADVDHVAQEAVRIDA